MAEDEYSLSDLADLADVTPRTIRYYVGQGLLPSPGLGAGTRYSAGHLARLRLIRQLQRAHLPLAEIRNRLAALSDGEVAALLQGPTAAPPANSALDYVRSVLGEVRPTIGGPAYRVSPMIERQAEGPDSGDVPAPAASEPSAALARSTMSDREVGRRLLVGSIQSLEPIRAAASDRPVEPERSQWDRIRLSPDVEIHVRRPLDRHANRRVERLLTLARELFKEDEP